MTRKKRVRSSLHDLTFIRIQAEQINPFCVDLENARLITDLKLENFKAGTDNVGHVSHGSHMLSGVSTYAGYTYRRFFA